LNIDDDDDDDEDERCFGTSDKPYNRADCGVITTCGKIANAGAAGKSTRGDNAPVGCFGEVLEETCAMAMASRISPGRYILMGRRTR